MDLSPYYVKAAQENMDYFFGEPGTAALWLVSGF